MKSGLDYTKMVIITNPEYIGTSDAIVDADEYRETREQMMYIKKDVQLYIDDYVDGVSGKGHKYDEKEFQRIYKYSTLKYFHRELSVESYAD